MTPVFIQPKEIPKKVKNEYQQPQRQNHSKACNGREDRIVCEEQNNVNHKARRHSYRKGSCRNIITHKTGDHQRVCGDERENRQNVSGEVRDYIFEPTLLIGQSD
jgi:hypothetical protein